MAGGTPARGGLGRQVATQGKARDFEKHRKNENGQGDHEDGDLGIRLAGQIGGRCRRHGDGECRSRANAHQGCGGDGETLETFPLGRRRFVHGIDVETLSLRWVLLAPRMRFEFVSILLGR